jgi:hypothetical protein
MWLWAENIRRFAKRHEKEATWLLGTLEPAAKLVQVAIRHSDHFRPMPTNYYLHHSLANYSA